MCQSAGNDELIEQHGNVEHEDDDNNLGKDQENVVGTAGKCHFEEDAEDVERQQGDDGCLYDNLHQLAHFAKTLFQCGGMTVGYAQSGHEREHEGCHDIEQRWNLDFKEGE